MTQFNSFTALILTYNDEKMIARLLGDLVDVKTVLIVDSYSEDNTVAICKSFGRKVIQNKFMNQGTQCNWAFDNFFEEGEWILRLDSDERVEGALLSELEALAIENNSVVGYIHREMYWMGQKLKFSALRKHFIGRFFRVGSARYEEVTEEHLVHDCPRVNLKTKFYEHNIKNSIEFFLQKHTKTAKGEVFELLNKDVVTKGSFVDQNDHVRRRWLKTVIYNNNPLFLRALMYFIYRYFFKLGFLDGRAGFSFCFFQAFFYRMLIDQIYWEHSQPGRELTDETI